MNTGKWKILLCPLGSWGDVHPFVWIGKLLTQRGYEVIAPVAEPFEEAMQHVGVKTIRLLGREEFEKLVRHPDIWHPRRAFKVVLQSILESCKPTMEILRRENEPGRTLIISGGIAFGARIMAEALRIPQIGVQLQPSVFISAEKPCVMAAGLEWMQRLPRPLLQPLVSLIHLQIDSLLKKKINALRHSVGLKGNVSRIMGDYWMPPDGVIATFPEWFAPKASDWPPQTHLTRFPLYDEYDRLDCPPELDAFLSAGDPPILFTPGSANCAAQHFFVEATKTCQRLQRRGIFVTRYPEQVPTDLPAAIKVFSFVPFSLVFPRCAAVVYHGGIGTLAQTLAADVPHLVMAMSHDQPDNGMRLRRMGVGDYVYPKRFRTEIIAPILERLLTSKDTATACAKYRDLLRAQMSEEDFVALIETLGRKAGLP